MEKYIVVEIPTKNKKGNYIPWWVPEKCLQVIKILEKENPNYNFHQIVTSPGNGGYEEFAIMNLKK